MSPPELTLIRHGETEWSASGRHTGLTDVPLTPAGERQAEAAGMMVGELLDGAKFDRVLVSPLQRAVRTAELAGLEPLEVLDDLHEWDYGDLEGETTPDIQERYPGWSIWAGPWPGGESAGDVSARADRVIATCLKEPPGSRVALVGHGHILRSLGARWLRADLGAGGWLALGTAGVCQLGWEHDAPVITLWNQSPLKG